MVQTLDLKLRTPTLTFLSKKKLSIGKNHTLKLVKFPPVVLTVSLITSKPHSFKDYLLSVKEFLEPASTFTARFTFRID